MVLRLELWCVCGKVEDSWCGSGSLWAKDEGLCCPGDLVSSLDEDVVQVAL